MATEDAIRSRIADLIGRRKNVTFEEIKWVYDQLSSKYPCKTRKTTHGTLFRIGHVRFMVNSHNPGSKQVKTYSVDEFARAMTELGWYD